MIISTAERILWTIALLGAVVFAVMPYVREVQAVSDVEVVEKYYYDRWLYLTVNFYKHDGCTIQDAVWLGKRLGLSREVTHLWQPSDINERRHRLEGDQTLQGRMHLKGTDYDTLELRVRHDCNGIRVDTSLFKVPVSPDNWDKVVWSGPPVDF